MKIFQGQGQDFLIKATTKPKKFLSPVPHKYLKLNWDSHHYKLKFA